MADEYTQAEKIIQAEKASQICGRGDCFNPSAFELLASIHTTQYSSPMTLLCGLDCCNEHSTPDKLEAIAEHILPHLQYVLEKCGGLDDARITANMVQLFWMPKGSVNFDNCERGEFKKVKNQGVAEIKPRFIGEGAECKNKLN